MKKNPPPAPVIVRLRMWRRNARRLENAPPSRWPQPDFLPAWGTREAIATLDGCIPLSATARTVAFADLDAEGFVRLEAEPVMQDHW